MQFRFAHVSGHLLCSRVSHHTRRLSPFSCLPRAVGRQPIIMSGAGPALQRKIHTAGCIIIGDEILSGSTVDTNSAYMAKFCFGLGIDLKRIEVIGDEENEIAEAATRFSQNYDFVVTSGGIGPTHDDITYQSLATAFGLPLKLHAEAYDRMKRLSTPHPSQPDFDWDTPSPALTAKRRMVELPTNNDNENNTIAEASFVEDSLWVPLVTLNGNVHVLPGVPRLFERMLEALRPRLLPRLTGDIYRIVFSTPLAESAFALFLHELADRVRDSGVKVGSYPKWGQPENTVTLMGRDRDLMESLVEEVEESIKGKRLR